MKIMRSAVVAAPVTGVLLGSLDFVWIKYVPGPFGGLGNSMAVWAVAAFLLTFGHRWSLPVSVAAAAAQLVIAVPSYYLAAALIQHDAWSNMVNANALLWMAFGVIAGAVFGAGGMLAREQSDSTPGRADAGRVPGSGTSGGRPGRAAAWLSTAALALPGSVLFAEAVLQARRIGDPSYPVAELTSYTIVVIVIGLGTTVMITRTWTRRGLVLLLALPLTAAGVALLGLAGFR
ncbi:DUF6518 family protein [Actinoplanes palleronii]|nr:DUF6518 family protein [Actinoplanes palleronii]